MNKIANEATSGLASADHWHWLQSDRIRNDNSSGITGQPGQFSNTQQIYIQGNGYANGGYVTLRTFLDWIAANMRIADTRAH